MKYAADFHCQEHWYALVRGNSHFDATCVTLANLSTYPYDHLLSQYLIALWFQERQSLFVYFY